MVISWDFNYGDLIVFYGDFMGFNGDLMGFNGDLMGFNGDLMGFYGDFNWFWWCFFFENSGSSLFMEFVENFMVHLMDRIWLSQCLEKSLP